MTVSVKSADKLINFITLIRSNMKAKKTKLSLLLMFAFSAFVLRAQ
ncbi:MAG: hypothetical protein JWO06_1039, partial [Bacteroidota bacterium]|nr:hypothetical protein [Bacteroidota bacterium]